MKENWGRFIWPGELCSDIDEAIGHTPDSPIPDGVHWDTFLGPAPYRAFNLNRYIYNWHWFWDTGTTEFGNNGIYRMDLARWVLGINTHPEENTLYWGKIRA